MFAGLFFLMVLFTALTLGCEAEEKPQPEVTIQLGGQSCTMYQGAIRSALTKLPGVQETDFASRKGHVTVRGNPEVMKANQVLDAVNGLQGEGWFCSGTLVR